MVLGWVYESPYGSPWDGISGVINGLGVFEKTQNDTELLKLKVSKLLRGNYNPFISKES
jgi:hypothetical protein